MECAADSVQILNCPALALCLIHVTKVKALFPTGDSVVCSAESNIVSTISQMVGYRRELLRFRRLHFIERIHAHRYITAPFYIIENVHCFSSAIVSLYFFQ